MSDHNLLLSLPVVLGASIIADWLPLKCTGCLDAAVCNRKLRGFFLCLLRAPGFRFTLPSESVLRDDSLYQYSQCRGMMLLSLYVKRGFRLDVIERMLQQSGSSITDVAIGDVPSNSHAYLNLVAKYCNGLKVIHLDSCDLDHSFLSILQKNTLTLTGLRLLHPNVSPHLLKNVRLTNLIMLILEGVEITDSVFTAFLCITTKNVTILTIFDCSVSPETVATIGDLCPHLQIFIIQGTVRMSGALVTVSQKCTQIRDLHVIDVSFRVGDLQRILSHLHQLHILQLARNLNLTNGDLAVLGREHGADLLVLSLQQCAGYNAAGLCELLKLCPLLTKLFLETTPAQITPQVIECIQHTALRSLTIFSHTPDEVKHAICRYGKSLTHIGLRCASHDTDEPYHSIVRNCTLLKGYHVFLLPVDVYESMRTAYPWIDVQRETIPAERVGERD